MRDTQLTHSKFSRGEWLFVKRRKTRQCGDLATRRPDCGRLPAPKGFRRSGKLTFGKQHLQPLLRPKTLVCRHIETDRRSSVRDGVGFMCEEAHVAAIERASRRCNGGYHLRRSRRPLCRASAKHRQPLQGVGRRWGQPMPVASFQRRFQLREHGALRIYRGDRVMTLGALPLSRTSNGKGAAAWEASMLGASIQRSGGPDGSGSHCGRRSRRDRARSPLRPSHIGERPSESANRDPNAGRFPSVVWWLLLRPQDDSINRIVWQG